MAPGMPAAGVARVLETIAADPGLKDGRHLRLPGAMRHPHARLLTVGLLRDLAAASFAEIARRIGRCSTNAKSLYGLHQRAILEDADYASAVRTLADAVVSPLRPPPNLIAKREILF